MSSGEDLVVAVDSVAEFTGTLEGHHLAVSQDHFVAGGRVASFALALGFDAEFAETGNEYILAHGKGIFHDDQQVFNNIYRTLL